MRITFHGAARTTGSRLLLECGLYQGKRKEAFERNRNLPFDASSVDACVLSHAHIDHSGNLPSLVKSGYRGPIYATPATRDLCEIMLLDSAYLQGRDVEYVNKKRARQGKNPFEPLYGGRWSRACGPRSTTPATSSARRSWRWRSAKAAAQRACSSRETWVAGTCPSSGTRSWCAT